MRTLISKFLRFKRGFISPTRSDRFGRYSIDKEVAALPAKEQTDPVAISKVIRRQSRGGRASSVHLPSPSPSARKRRRTSFGRPMLYADGSDDDEEGEVARQVTPAPKRRARASLSSRRASVAFAPNTDPKDRRKSKAQVRFGVLSK